MYNFYHHKLAMPHIGMIHLSHIASAVCNLWLVTQNAQETIYSIC